MLNRVQKYLLLNKKQVFLLTFSYKCSNYIFKFGMFAKSLI